MIVNIVALHWIIKLIQYYKTYPSVVQPWDKHLDSQVRFHEQQGFAGISKGSMKNGEPVGATKSLKLKVHDSEILTKFHHAAVKIVRMDSDHQKDHMNRCVRSLWSRTHHISWH